ncbi:hypothetical protein K439DRAFT_444583 [Ramaria rubella]|nr:hypothetical protein K439DRAFT_444583 [Ramaria rubella]
MDLSLSSRIFFKKIALTVLDELRKISAYDRPQTQRTVLILYHHLYDILSAGCFTGFDKKLLVQIVAVKVITTMLGRNATETCVAGMTALHGAGSDPKSALKRFIFLGLLTYRSNCPEAGNDFDQHNRYGGIERAGVYSARPQCLHDTSPCPWMSKMKDALFKRFPNPLRNTWTPNVAQSLDVRPPVSQTTFDRYISGVLKAVHPCTGRNLCDNIHRQDCFPRGNYWGIQREEYLETREQNDLMQNHSEYSRHFTSAHQDVEEAVTV